MLTTLQRRSVNPTVTNLTHTHVHVSALTYYTTMTTCPSGLSVTVYQMVKPSDGR